MNMMNMMPGYGCGYGRGDAISPASDLSSCSSASSGTWCAPPGWRELPAYPAQYPAYWPPTPAATEEARELQLEQQPAPIPPVAAVGSTNYGTVPVTSAPKQMSLNYAAVAPTMAPSVPNYNSGGVFGSGVMSGWYPEVRQDHLYPRPGVRDHRMYQQYPAPISAYQCATKENYAVFQGHYNLQPPVALGQ
ncbi:hypothetical protein B5X24_HaOG202011 [Helicoverpa armigera]|uniref:Uncharacterized protein n=1 Tax=Helicoverpa armigera TaxID=29058 RepID=A0A2W1BTZ2_HELAM|nr:hypothetical protein B5X24_HaOG202011 [Helicoverpa armigera]